MSAHLHIANNYNDVVDVITSLIAIYGRNMTIEPTQQQATHKQREHKQMVSKLYHSINPFKLLEIHNQLIVLEGQLSHLTDKIAAIVVEIHKMTHQN